MSASNSGSSRTRLTEGFYRAQQQQQQQQQQQATTPTTPSGDGAMAPVQPQTMDRDRVSAVTSGAGGTGASTTMSGVALTRKGSLTRPGALRPPNELGRQETNDGEDNNSNNNSNNNNSQNTPNHAGNAKFKTPAVHPRSAAVRKRTMAAIKGSMTHAATAMSAEALAAAKQKTNTDDPAMLCSMTYRGMEVVFASTHAPRWAIYGICARTRLVFQTLDLPTPTTTHDDDDDDDDIKTTSNVGIVGVMANQTSGLIAIALADGTIQTYVPVPTDPKVHAFGRFRWINGVTIRCSRVFYQHGETIAIQTKRKAKPGQSMIMVSSQDQKLLVAHRNQLAVFDVNVAATITATNTTTSTAEKNTTSASSESGDDNHNTTSTTTTTTTQQQQPSPPDTTSTSTTAPLEGNTPAVAQLLWTTTTDRPIVTASISGDGQAMAVVEDSGAAGVYDKTCGVRIFLRDRDDGSPVEESVQEVHSKSIITKLRRTPSVGILYKQGPFLEHSEPVTRISFRGLGHNTASVLEEADDEQGNDLLLTYSKHDCVARIYNQHSWNRLLEWTTPPNSRVDWVRGAAAFSLGDLETQKRLVPKSESRPPSRSPSSGNLAEEVNAGQGLLHEGRQLLHNSSPSSAAGAWIAEITFSGVLPALRLSRLSFLKRGSETMHPALFESVASMLPSGSMVADNILNAGDESLSIHGIWPAWNPWLSETSDVHSEETLSGSAMSFLGLSSGPSATSGGNFGEGILGGTHSPPNELRIVASHPLCGNVVIMEFPLWGNRDLGELELGNAIRYMLSLPDIEQETTDDSLEKMPGRQENSSITTIMASTDYESNRLVAKLRSDSTSISLSWRKQGTFSICPSSWEPHDYEQTLEETSLAQTWTESIGIADYYRDCSLLPAPLSLPPVYLPRSSSASGSGKDTVKTVIWWPDENYGGPPMLVVVTASGTLLVFEVPPPWSAQEPPMPTSDPFMDFSESIKGVESHVSLQELSAAGGGGPENDSDDDAWSGSKEYDVNITPHPDFGLGLRLESQMDGMPAVAGSYKKHPLTGGSLPAEKVGMIVLGDELLSVNGVSLEGISFDEIIATVRSVGAGAVAGSPICMRFRRANGRRRRAGLDNPDPFSMEVQTSDGSRRTREEMLGVTGVPQRGVRVESPSSSVTGSYHKRMSPGSAVSDVGSNSNIPVGADGGVQQEFCRLVAKLIDFHPCTNGQSSRPCFVLLPWTNGSGGSHPGVRGVALLFFSEGGKIFARRLEVSADCKPEKGKACDLGVFDLSSSEAGRDDYRQPVVQSMSVIDTGTESQCLAVCDDLGSVSLIFASWGEQSNATSSSTQKSDFTVSFRHYGIFSFQDALYDSCIVRASSIDLIATMRCTTGKFPTVTVWSARPHPAGAKHEGNSSLNEYVGVDVSVGTLGDLVDLCFVQSGFLDSFPLLAAFSRTQVAIFQKMPGQHGWNPTRVVSYPSIPGSLSEVLPPHPRAIDNPVDSFPHLLSAIRSIIHNCDETQYLRTDWHPDALLARLCTDDQGPKHSLYECVASYYVWLSKLDENSVKNFYPEHTKFSSLSSVCLKQPFEDGYQIEPPKQQSSADLLSRITKEISNEDDLMLRKLQSVLENAFSQTDYKNGKFEVESEKQKALPLVLQSFTPDELRILWALGEVVLARPDFKSVDRVGQYFILSSELLTKIKLLPKEEGKESTGGGMHQFHFKRKVNKALEEVDTREQLPSAATLCALMSNSQNDLVESCRHPGVTVDWDFVREYNIPFWVRSDAALAKLSEEVGQNSFRAKRDILECALFFVVARKMRTLRNLAATDQTAGGKKFCSFLADHDFSSERGRRAAEKNAFSLLRKRKYSTAAAFFLLAEPPFLKSSLEVIATQLQDINLAFLVARLMESSEVVASNGRNGGAGGGMNSIIGLGGGGGYASFAPAPINPTPQNEVRFEAWRPNLKSGARNLLLDRGLSLSTDDNCLTAVQLMWLDERNEASYWLSGLIRDKEGKSILPDVGDAVLPIVLDRCNRGPTKTPTSSSNSDSQPSARVCSRVNNLINFLSGPIILKTMDANKRTRFASALVVSRILMRCGVDVDCVRDLLRDCDTKDEPTNGSKDPGQAKAQGASGLLSNGDQGSSIFDGFDTAPPSKTAAPSSIFVSYDVPRPPQKSAASSPAPSSIFDDYAAAPPKPKAPAPSDTMASSIFDSFNAPPPTAKQVPKQSSIFDDFDTAPPKPKTPAVPWGGMSSSIFDSFDAPPPKPKPKTPAPSSGDMSSSIFDSFDVPTSKSKQSAPSKLANSSTESTTSQEQIVSNKAGSEVTKEEDRLLHVLDPAETPEIWLEWREQVLMFSAARRLVRELACLMVELHGDAFDPPFDLYSRSEEFLLPGGAAEILQLPCEGELILGRIRDLLQKICLSHGMHEQSVVELALRFLAIPHHHNRMFYAVLLHLSCQRGDLAEDLLRDAAHLTMKRCDSLSLSNDPPSEFGKTASHMASLSLRQQASRLGWQIELCLWLHRGGALPLSGVAINEAIIAVRIGFAIASWNRNYECLETMIKSDPDCHMDNEAGRQHWTSLKIISNSDGKERSTGKASSGGWEFLVDCRRSEATDLLRHKQTGCFIIRPHVEDHGVFTLSFKTNLVPTKETPPAPPADTTQPGGAEHQDPDKPPLPKPSRPVKKDDVVQHAIIRLSDSGFRCGSFGPFGSLMKLLEAVSASLPFDLRFDQPPAERVIKDEGSQPSPNAVFLRKLVLRSADSIVKSSPTINGPSSNDIMSKRPTDSAQKESESTDGSRVEAGKVAEEKVLEFRRSVFGMFLELLTLTSIRKPLSAIASSKYEDQGSDYPENDASSPSLERGEDDFSQTGGLGRIGEDYAASARILRPFLSWCRVLELSSECELAPLLGDVRDTVASPQITLSASETGIEAIEEEIGLGDSVIRRMIQPNSGVDFRTLRLADGGDSTVVVLFSKKEAIEWLMKFGSEKTREAALEKLDAMEKIRVIEPIDLSQLQLKAYSAQKGAKPEEDTGVRYRIVDPWEVEALDNREGETKSASIGRERFLAFSLGKVAAMCESVFREIGGLPALELWTAAKGGVALTKAIASVHPPWERGEGGDMHFVDRLASEPSPFSNSIRQHLYRNSLFRSIRLPQRFVALVQVELLDLKNLTAPGGSLSLTVYALLRLRRSDSGAPLTSKTRTLDSAATPPMKLAKSSGPNAPASWGSVVRFRFPLPEDVSSNGVSLDRNREILFKGPPCVLQLSVYERKLLIDNPLGDADVKIDGLAAGGQLEEWVPLRTGKHGIHWFARIRLTLRFELMCLASDATHDDVAPSVGLRRIQHLSKMGGAQEDIKKSMSQPDLLSYFESMVY